MKYKESLTWEAMEAEFLKSEWYLAEYNSYRDVHNPHREFFDKIVTAPDLFNTVHNRIRTALLWQWNRRGFFLSYLPPDTKWRVSELEDGDFEKILIVKEGTWLPVFGDSVTLSDTAKAVLLDKVPSQNEHIEKIRRFKDRIGAADFNGSIIAITSSIKGPHTIIEGNHRAVALQLRVEESGDKSHLPRYIIVGESPNMQNCPWSNS